MQVKSEVFSRFGSSIDFSSGEPLGGVEASTVGADLCVRPSSLERSLFCGRTRRSAPTQATSARQFHSSNAVTPICRDAPTVRPLHQSETSPCRDARSERPLCQNETALSCYRSRLVRGRTPSDWTLSCVPTAGYSFHSNF